MEKLIFEQMKGVYHKKGGYFLPDLTYQKKITGPSAHGASGICATSENIAEDFTLTCS